MSFTKIFDAISDFLVNIPNFLKYFFDIVNDTINLIPQPFCQIIKVLLVIATVVLIVKAVKNQ